MRSVKILVAIAMLMSCAVSAAPKPADVRLISVGEDGKLKYASDATGNKVPDYSYAGYMGGGVAIPNVPVKVMLRPADGDQTIRIQTAVDYVAKLPADANGIHGAIFFSKGEYRIAGQIKIRSGGIILRGDGDQSVLLATGLDRRTLLQISGVNDAKMTGDLKISDPYIPVGAMSFRVQNDNSAFQQIKVGSEIIVRHPSTTAWIDQIGMHQFPGREGGDFRFSWVPGKFDLTWRRKVVGIDKNMVSIDAPITTSLDEKVGGGTVSLINWAGQIAQVGIESLRCQSEYEKNNVADEDHSWIAIGMQSARDCWVRKVSTSGFAGSSVNILETCDRITVEDCQSEKPISEIAGYRRHTFYSNGQRILFLRCRADAGRRDFAAGYFSTGPSAFVYCEATDAHDFSGTIESWASGVLFDNLITDGQIRLDNREIWDQGTGWTSDSSMLWNCVASVVTVRSPPGGRNFVFGCWGALVGDGHWGVVNEFIKPESLYFQQLRERVGDRAYLSNAKDLIPNDLTAVKTIEQAAPELLALALRPVAKPKKKLTLKNGQLFIDGKIATGERTGVGWWKGRIVPDLASTYGVNITRFVPGRIGSGLTDDLDQLTDSMLANGKVMLAHNWGLWYDERRQDHEPVRRTDSDVWPPFYEQAWKRNGATDTAQPWDGQSKAFDGLSKYDLTKFNPWYFSRLKEFADRCDEKGLVLMNKMYFQHNILEAGAHWMDAPFRPANSIQNLGFPEPPPLENRKRIFMADAFYDLSNAKLKEFHRAFIRHSLENFSNNSNVMHTIGEEFTGPLPFMQFWIDTIAEWEKETGQYPLICLSCTKDVQDAILADAVRAKVVNVIEMKYWWPLANGTMFEPKSGQNLSPRQQIREAKGKTSRSESEVLIQIRKYRAAYPDKAFIVDGAKSLQSSD